MRVTLPTSGEATWLARTPWYPDAKDDIPSDDGLSSSPSVTSAVARSSSLFGPRRLKDADDFDVIDKEALYQAGDLQDDSFLTFSLGAFEHRRKFSNIRYTRLNTGFSRDSDPLRRDRGRAAKKRYGGTGSTVARMFDVAKCFS